MDSDEAAAVADVTLERRLAGRVEDLSIRADEDDGIVAAEHVRSDDAGVDPRGDAEVVALAERLDRFYGCRHRSNRLMEGVGLGEEQDAKIRAAAGFAAGPGRRRNRRHGHREHGKREREH